VRGPGWAELSCRRGTQPQGLRTRSCHKTRGRFSPLRRCRAPRLPPLSAFRAAPPAGRSSFVVSHPSAKNAEGWATLIRGLLRVRHPPPFRKERGRMGHPHSRVIKGAPPADKFRHDERILHPFPRSRFAVTHPSAKNAEGWATLIRGLLRVRHPPSPAPPGCGAYTVCALRQVHVRRRRRLPHASTAPACDNN
jgi:hypothetical protein